MSGVPAAAAPEPLTPETARAFTEEVTRGDAASEVVDIPRAPAPRSGLRFTGKVEASNRGVYVDLHFDAGSAWFSPTELARLLKDAELDL